MLEKICVACNKPFAAKTARATVCSGNCQMARWRQQNPKHSVNYQRAWRDKNPDAIVKYNAQRRQGWQSSPCAHCSKTFQKTSAASRYCSVKCRDKARRLRPGEKEKHRARYARWVNVNCEKVQADARKHYRKHAARKLHAQPWYGLIRGAHERARKKGLLFNLTNEWAKARWTGKCELTGIAFATPEKRVGYKNRNFSPSIDKITPEGGYTKDNCRIILWALNSFKRDSSDSDMFFIAEKLIQNRSPDVAAFLALPG